MNLDQQVISDGYTLLDRQWTGKNGHDMWRRVKHNKTGEILKAIATYKHHWKHNPVERARMTVKYTKI